MLTHHARKLPVGSPTKIGASRGGASGSICTAPYISHMRSGGVRGNRTAPERTGPLLLLLPFLALLILAGFLTMHGFLASVAPAAGTEPSGHTVSTDRSAAGAGGAALSPGPGSSSGHPPLEGQAGGVPAALTTALGGDSGHGPDTHSDVLAGCVLALVGIVGITLAVTAAGRRTALRTESSLSRVLPPAAAPATAHRQMLDAYRLCVMRV